MADSLQPGDVVQLNSGGPLMTVVKLWTNDKGVQMVSCCWFNSTKEDNGHFPIQALTKEGGL